MISFIIGKIVAINKKSITIESNWTGYIVYVTNPDKYEVGKVKKIYVYKHFCMSNKNTLCEDYYGFYSFEERELFYKLLTLNGIGPKTAMQILKNDANLLRSMIASKDVKGLSSLSAINEKLARQIIDNINFDPSSNVQTNTKIAELISALKTLGYEKKDIDYVLTTDEINKNQSLDISDLISTAIKLIATSQEQYGITKTE